MITKDDGEAVIAKLFSVLETLAEAFDEHIAIPGRNCSCHIAPPCGDCVTWDFAREAREDARAMLAARQGGAE